MSVENIDERKTNEEQNQSHDDFGGSLILDPITPKRKGPHDVTIQVCNPVTKEEKFSKFTVYTIKGVDNEGNFEVLRRYSDFDKIRSLLLTRWPGCYIPPLPPKTSVGNMQNKFIEERKRLLHNFCLKVSDIPHLHYSEEYQIFIRSANTDLEKTFAPMMKFSNEDLISKYTVKFGHLTGKDTGTELVLKIAAFKVFLQKTQGYFVNCKKVAKSVSQARRAFYEQFSMFHNQVCVEYEKNVFSEYHGNAQGKNVFSDASSPELIEKTEKIKQASNLPSLEYLYEWLKIECNEIEVLLIAFLEAISQRDKYEALKNKVHDKQKADTSELNKILSGKTTVKSFFSRKSRDEEVSGLEKNIQQAGKEYESLKTINDMINLIIGYDEIEKFKTSKLESYYYVVKMAAQSELSNTKNVLGYWNIIAENENVKTA